MALTLMESECDYIMAPVLAGGLPRAEICCNIPRSVLAGHEQSVHYNEATTNIDPTR